ncbi:PREDICTED: uncharacterized protein LOC104821356 [Tarenaya hassleriana]|uniref:uncharacterized protein LOC104821356 n=1 Tax=Tarenaya hassleriana TaxID=28532 RepID=UPI00053C7BC7|nr:PREDICTED: uncharacterized protein LOC104821356 [Tarenaya hassleriana]
MNSSTDSTLCVRQELDIPEELMGSPEESAEESSRIVPFAPSNEESILEKGLGKEVNFSFLAPSPEKDRETIYSADTRDVSSSGKGSEFLTETEISATEEATMVEACSVNVSVPEMVGSEVLESENSGVDVRKTKETDAPLISISKPSSGFSVENENFYDKTGLINGVDVAFDGHNREEESSNLDEKGKETEVQRLLEAEKKRLLAEIEVGTIFGPKANAETVTSDSSFFKSGDDCQEVQETVEKMVLNDPSSDGRSLKVEVIDDTAMVDVVPIYKRGSDHSKRLEASRADTKNTEEITVNRKQGKGTRGKGKGKGNAAKKSAQVSEICDIVEKNRNPSKMMYSRKQLEAMRFAKIADQRKLWSDIYTGLAPEVVTEYESLASFKNQKNSKPNRDRARPFPRNRDMSILENNDLEEITGEGLVMEEEYCTEDDDSDEDYNSILKPAFAVEGEPDFDSGPPEDGFEYLRRVRWEAQQIPKVKIAKRDTSKNASKEQTIYMPQLPEIAKCLDHLLPTKEWEDAFLSDFSDLRLALSQLDASSMDSSDESGFVLNFEEDHRIMKEFNGLSSVETEEETKEFPSGKEGILLFDRNPKPKTATCSGFGEYPMLSDIQGMDSVTRVSTLRKRISMVEAGDGLQRSDCLWIFALSAAVDTPLDGDTCGCLRGLLRKCAGTRAGKSEVDEEVVMANILATISGRYFGQMERE